MNMSVASRPRLHPLSLSHIRQRPSNPLLPVIALHRTFSASAAPRIVRRSHDFGGGFISSYDPNQDTGRGPMFTRPSFGVPQFYPRDLKARVDEYVVGQDRAKKTICSAIFNHYQSLRRRRHDQDSELRALERSSRQKWARDRDRHHEMPREPHPVEGEAFKTPPRSDNVECTDQGSRAQTSSRATTRPYNRASSI